MFCKIFIDESSSTTYQNKTFINWIFFSTLLESQRQQLSLEEKLAKRRRREIQKLSKEQEKEEQLLMKNIDKSTNTKGLVEVSGTHCLFICIWLSSTIKGLVEVGQIHSVLIFIYCVSL